MSTTATQPNEMRASEVRNCIEAWARCVRNKDADTLVSLFADDAQMFDLAPPLRPHGAVAVRKRAEEWFSTFATSIDYEVHDLRIEVTYRFRSTCAR